MKKFCRRICVFGVSGLLDAFVPSVDEFVELFEEFVTPESNWGGFASCARTVAKRTKPTVWPIVCLYPFLLVSSVSSCVLDLRYLRVDPRIRCGFPASPCDERRP